MKEIEWIWKPIAAFMVPIAVAATPAMFAWIANDRGVDKIIVTSAFSILEKDPRNFGESKTREWAIRVIERYSGERFSKQAKKELETGPLPISQTAANPNPASQEELSQAVVNANTLNNAKLLKIAISQLGVSEISGGLSNPQIIAYNGSIGAKFGDEIPWNSQFMNWVVKEAGHVGTNDARSRSWEAWGKSVEDEVSEQVIPGCIAVLWRSNPSSWGGTVGIYVGQSKDGQMRILGGNFFNSVDVVSLKRERLLTCRLPSDWKGPAQ